MRNQRTRVLRWGIAASLLSVSGAWSVVRGSEPQTTAASAAEYRAPIGRTDIFNPLPVAYQTGKDGAAAAPTPSLVMPQPAESGNSSPPQSGGTVMPGPWQEVPVRIGDSQMLPGPMMPFRPPMGTLGYTYRRFSAPIPRDKHPRTGMLDVFGLQCDSEVTIEGMRGYRTAGGFWRFESEMPLFPGIPHVYRVVARNWRDGIPFTEVRTVRLIPGRIVSLDFLMTAAVWEQAPMGEIRN